jgi:anti-sigma factor RsiW
MHSPTNGHAGHEHLACQEFVELVTDYLDDALTPHDRSLFEEHFNFCEGCVFYLDQMQRTIEAVGALAEEEVPGEAMERLLGAFREWRRA